VEAQNRAIAQRINLAKSAKQIHEDRVAQEHSADARIWRNANGYRNWKDLDSVFITMGPNYVAQSDVVGPTICKVYEEETSVLKELMAKPPPLGLGKAADLEEEVKMKDLISSMFKVDPEMTRSTLRPIVGKDASTISREELTAATMKPTLRVKVRSALNLRSKGGFLEGSVQPKVIIEIPGKPQSRWESRVAPDSKHVVWDEEGIIPDYNYGDDLRIMVVDKEWIGFDSHLGEARLPGTDFYPDSLFSQLPLMNADPRKGNSDPARGEKGASIMIEVKVVEPLGKTDAWPPTPAVYAPMYMLNESDLLSQRLANWDRCQCAKLPFADVNPNYQKHEDIWGALETAKSVDQGMVTALEDGPLKPRRVKDECLMA